MFCPWIRRTSRSCAAGWRRSGTGDASLTPRLIHQGCILEYSDTRRGGGYDPIDLNDPHAFAPWPEPLSRMVRVSILPRADQTSMVTCFWAEPKTALGHGLSGIPFGRSPEYWGAAERGCGLRGGTPPCGGAAEIDAAKTAFFSNVSHEFRTPLTLMLSPLEDLLERPAQEPVGESRELVTVAHRNALRLLKLVNALLDFSRIEAGRVRARYQPTDLAQFTAELASNFRSPRMPQG